MNPYSHLNKCFLTLNVLIFLFISTSVNSQTVIFIKPNGSGNGSSWAQARGDLRNALSSASAGTQIWVASGIYYPTNCVNCTLSDRQLSFEIPNGVALYGGFIGTETAINQRHLSSNTPSVLSGNIDRDTTILNNTFNIIYTKNVNSNTILDGFTVSDANANANVPFSERGTSGGAWFNDARLNGFGSPMIENCIFKNNNVIAYGGAIYNSAGYNGNCYAVFTHCQFENNHSGQEGGAVNNQGSFGGTCNPSFIFCNFTQNTAQGSGAAVFSQGSGGVADVTYRSCRFVRNSTPTYGAAIYNLGNNGHCSPTVTNCLFWGNSAYSAGGVYCLGGVNGYSNPVITNCIFYKNIAHTGGSVYLNGNDSTGHVGGKITNCIIWNNTAEVSPVLRSYQASPVLKNCILNTSSCADVYYGSFGGNPQCGEGNFYNTNPLFVDADMGDFRLLPASPAVNAGQNAALDSIGLLGDLDNFQRVVGTRVDIGAIEYNPDLAYYAPQLISSPPSRPMCQNARVVLKANFTGSPPLSFQWLKNGVILPNELTDSLKFASVSLSDSGTYKCIARNTTLNSAATDNIILTTKPAIPLSNRIFTDRIPACEGDTAIFHAEVINGGTAAAFEWRINGQPLGLPTSTTAVRMPINSPFQRFTCFVTSSEQCATPNSLLSNELQYPVLPPSAVVNVGISTPQTNICTGDNVTFTANPTGGGATPQYQWFLNELNIGINSNRLTINTLRNNDKIKVRLTSSVFCAINRIANSDSIVMKVRTCTNVDDIDRENIILYPNPNTTRHFTIKGLDNITDNEILIYVYSPTGQAVFSKKINPQGGDIDVNFDNKTLSTGIYTIRITTKYKVFLRKWIFKNI